MRQLWIAGGGGAALEAWAVLRAMEEAGRAPGSFRGFLVVEPPQLDPKGYEVRGEPDFLASADPASCQVIVALGSPRARQRAARGFLDRGFSLAALIHPSAILGPETTLGEGCIVMAQAVLETHVRVGALGMINVHASIAHECTLGEACSLGPGARLAGRVALGDRCDLGVGAVVRPGVVLGNDVVVGAGAAVVKDHPGCALLVGVPARPRP